ncbi:hypothetical protein ABTM38_19880, partial [Acinetobacter baumannii]
RLRAREPRHAVPQPDADWLGPCSGNGGVGAKLGLPGRQVRQQAGLEHRDGRRDLDPADVDRLPTGPGGCQHDDPPLWPRVQ